MQAERKRAFEGKHVGVEARAGADVVDVRRVDALLGRQTRIDARDGVVVNGPQLIILDDPKTPRCNPAPTDIFGQLCRRVRPRQQSSFHLQKGY